MAIVIFDLDGTVIDTAHRYRNGPDGHIDLDFWFANSTPEMVARDALLPLAGSMRRFYDRGHTVVICTARDWTRNDLMPIGFDPGATYEKFLADNDLPYHHLLYRNLAGPDHATLGDGELKVRMLTDLALGLGFTCIADMNAIMYDDNRVVIETLTAHRVRMFDAIQHNKLIASNRARRAA